LHSTEREGILAGTEPLLQEHAEKLLKSSVRAQFIVGLIEDLDKEWRTYRQAVKRLRETPPFLAAGASKNGGTNLVVETHRCIIDLSRCIPQEISLHRCKGNRGDFFVL
jgi:hypothetical protein